MSILSFLKTSIGKLLETPARSSIVKLGRNSPCHCGSGKKYKKCHLTQDKIEEQNKVRNQNLANMNRNSEPNWDPLLGPEGSIAQQGLSNAKETMDKLKR